MAKDAKQPLPAAAPDVAPEAADAQLAGQREALTAQARYVAHELGNLLTGLSLTLELMQAGSDPATQRRYLARCLQLTERLSERKELLSALGGHPAQPPAWCATAALFAGACARLGATDVAVHQRIDPAAARVFGQQTLLEEALLQLLRNAVDAAGEAGKAVTLTARAAGAAVVLGVEDEGPGPPADLLPRLGRRPTSTKPHAVGLGLVRVALIAESLHRGRFVLARRSPGGAVATLTLPNPP